MAAEGLSAHAVSDVPKLRRGITRPRHKRVPVRAQRQTHDITRVTRETDGLLARLDIPQGTAQRGGGALSVCVKHNVSKHLLMHFQEAQPKRLYKMVTLLVY